MVVVVVVATQERAHAYRDEEVKDASQAIIQQHAQMHRTDAYHELRMHEPNMQIQTEVRAHARAEHADTDRGMRACLNQNM